MSFQLIHVDGQEVYQFKDKSTGLNGMIAIHSTRLGPALGGCRCVEYTSEEAALQDALRLAKGMTYKAAVAGLHLGGGKAVLLKPKTFVDRPAYFQAYGRFVDELKGQYITAEDSGTSVEDMDSVASVTSHVTGTSFGRFHTHDPGVLTALGVYRGIEAAVEFKLGSTSLSGLHMVVQGLGHVGERLVAHLHRAGVRLSFYDILPSRLERCAKVYQATALTAQQVYMTPCDVFVPCALGGILNQDTIETLDTQIVAGAANNQLATEEMADRLAQKNILYAPDYVINAGGLIHVGEQYNQISEIDTQKKVERIGQTLKRIFQQVEQTGESSIVICRKMAQARLEQAATYANTSEECF